MSALDSEQVQAQIDQGHYNGLEYQPPLDLDAVESQTAWFIDSGLADLIITDIERNPHNTLEQPKPKDFWFWSEVRVPVVPPDPTISDDDERAAECQARRGELGYELVVLAQPKAINLPTDSTQAFRTCPVSLRYEPLGCGGSEARLNRNPLTLEQFTAIVNLASQRVVEDPNFFGSREYIRC